MACTSDCGSDAISITDEQLWDKPICRDFNYYVDPSSSEIIELGTKAYPYKSIGLPFVEILNYHSHSDRTIHVYLKENEDHQMLSETTYIINITQVTVESYSETDSSTSIYANLIMRNSGVTFFNSRTVFNILKHSTLRLSSIVRTSEISVAEDSNSKFLFSS